MMSTPFMESLPSLARLTGRMLGRDPSWPCPTLSPENLELGNRILVHLKAAGDAALGLTIDVPDVARDRSGLRRQNHGSADPRVSWRLGVLQEGEE